MRKITLFLGVVLGFTSFAFAADAKLTLVGNPTIIIDPQCNPDGKGAVKAKIRNQGSSGTGAISLYLAPTDITSKPPGKSVNGIIKVQSIKGANDDQPSDKKELGPGEETWIKIEASKIDQVGEWETTLQNENVDVGKIRIVRNELPFPVSLDVPTPDAAELTFVQGQPSSFRFKNDGPNDLSVTWEYSIDGHTLRPTDTASRSQWQQLTCDLTKDCPTATVAPSPVLLPKNGLAPVNFYVPADWFGSRFVGLFKDNVQDGRLMVSRVDPTCPSAISTKIFKVKTHLATSFGSSRELCSDLWIFLFLLAGGICSLILNFALPNQMRRQKLKETLQGLGRQIFDLSSALASRLRVLAGREQRLLRDRLNRLTWTNNDFAGEMQNIEQASTRLGTRIQLLDRLGGARADFESMRSLNLAPTVIVSMDQAFEKVVAIGAKAELTDANLQSAQALIQTLQDQMDSGGKSNAAWISGLANRVTDLKTKFDATNGVIAKTATWKRIQPHLSGEVGQVSATAPAHLPEQDYIVLDRAMFKLELAVDYVRKVDPLPVGDALGDKIRQHESALMELLKQDSWENLEMARRLIQEMQDGKFKEDIKNAASKITVKRDRILVRQFEPCEFSLDCPQELNHAVAREEWACKWEFTNANGNEPALSEEGWEVTHYFQRPETYQLKVTLTDKTSRESLVLANTGMPEVNVGAESRRRLGKVVAAILKWNWTEAGKEWNKSRTGAGRVLETLWLILALFLALIGMIAGAKDQILKLDVVPAMIAIFLVGFGADQVKNLLTRHQQ